MKKGCGSAVMEYLQRLGKSLMLPVSVLPVCGIIMGLGYFLCPDIINGAEISGAREIIGSFLVKAGTAVIDNLPVLFALGVAMGMSEDGNGTACLAGIVSWLEITLLLKPETAGIFLPSLTEGTAAYIAFEKIQNPFTGIISGIIGAECYNRFHRTKLPDTLAFFSGKRSVSIVTVFVSLTASVLLLFIWPTAFSGMVKLGNFIAGLGGIGAGLYAFLNRLLIPLGLHHALNNVFWFDTIGLGDITNYWAGRVSADVSWSLGMYMSGFFPCMLMGVPGAALAMIRTAKDKKKARGVLYAVALCSFVCGLTEPFEFSFMFASFPLYVCYSILYGIFAVITYYTGFRAGFTFSGGIIDLIFSSAMPAAQKTWLIIPLGLAAFIVFYLVFRFAIEKFDLPTPGREPEDESGENASGEKKNPEASHAAGTMGQKILEAVGGKENVVLSDCCATRLRLTLKDTSLVDEKYAKAAGAKAVMITGENSCQVVIGVTVQQVLDEFNEAMKAENAENPERAHRTVKAGEPVIVPAGSGPFTHIIKDPLGIHARPAGEMVNLVKDMDCEVTVSLDGKKASAKSIIELMKLGAAAGSSLEVTAQGKEAGKALYALRKFMEEKL